MRAALGVLLASAALAACQREAPQCRDATVFVSLAFDASARQADELDVVVTVDGSSHPTRVTRTSGRGSDSIEINFPSGYPSRKTVSLEIVARLGGTIVGRGFGSVGLSGACGLLDLDVTVDGKPPDASVGDLENPSDMPAFPQLVTVRVARAVQKVDLLFMVDNSISMAPKQVRLRAQFPKLIQALDGFAAEGRPAHYHIAVVNSNLGTGPIVLPGCTPGGDGAKMRAIWPASPGTCLPLANGGNFIDYDQINGMNNLPPDAGLADSFSCMAAVGDTGCGLEHQLEAVFKALREPIQENQGFLRADAALVVVLVTDEDDCSAAPDSTVFNPTNTLELGMLASYRCARFGIQCGLAAPMRPPYEPTGVLTDCVGASVDLGALLFETRRYIDYFTQPAPLGVKFDPSDVVLVSIAAPAAPVQVIAGPLNTQTPCTCAQEAHCVPNIDGGCNPSTQQCENGTTWSYNNNQGCLLQLKHSCVSAGDSTFFGDPAVRVSEVVKAVKSHHETSICDDDYSPAMQQIGALIGGQLHPGCLPGTVSDPSRPICFVQDQTLVGSTVVATQIPACADSGGTPPCWLVETNPRCPALTDATGGSQQLALRVDRGPGGQPPANTAPTGACEVEVR